MVTELGGTGIQHELSIIRSVDTDIPRFRSAIHRIGLHLAVAVSARLSSDPCTVTTPLATIESQRIHGNIILVPVLRAGLGLLQAFLDIFPDARVGFHGLRRNEQTLQPAEYYSRFPATTLQTTMIVLDPMLATAGSMRATIQHLQRLPHHKMMAACIIGAPEGKALMEQEHPAVDVVVAALDSHLNPHGFIVPGLGDAGDRLYGAD